MRTRRRRRPDNIGDSNRVSLTAIRSGIANGSDKIARGIIARRNEMGAAQSTEKLATNLFDTLPGVEALLNQTDHFINPVGFGLQPRHPVLDETAMRAKYPRRIARDDTAQRLHMCAGVFV